MGASHIIHPNKGKQLTPDQKRFNWKISRVRQKIERIESRIGGSPVDVGCFFILYRYHLPSICGSSGVLLWSILLLHFKSIIRLFIIARESILIFAMKKIGWVDGCRPRSSLIDSTNDSFAIIIRSRQSRRQECCQPVHFTSPEFLYHHSATFAVCIRTHCVGSIGQGKWRGKVDIIRHLALCDQTKINNVHVDSHFVKQHASSHGRKAIQLASSRPSCSVQSRH